MNFRVMFRVYSKRSRVLSINISKCEAIYYIITNKINKKY